MPSFRNIIADKKYAKKDDVVYDFIHVVINLKTNYYLIDLDKGVNFF